MPDELPVAPDPSRHGRCACMDARDYLVSVLPQTVHLVFTSPPYLGVQRWAIPDDAAYFSMLEQVIQLSTDTLVPGGYSIWNLGDVPGGNDGFHSLLHPITDLHHRFGLTLRGHLIWRKGVTSPMPPPCFMRRPCVPHLTHEHLLIFVKGPWKARELHIALSPDERAWLSQSVWDISPVTGGSSDTRERRRLTTPFPLALADRVVRLFSLPGETVLDPFCGAGTALVAAKSRDRQYLGCDTNQACIDYARAWLAHTSPEPVDAPEPELPPEVADHHNQITAADLLPPSKPEPLLPFPEGAPQC